MAKRTVEIEDDLDERVEDLQREVREDFLDWLEQNPDLDDFDDYYQDRGCDFVHEASDSATPIHYSDIDGLYYLYGSEFDEAYSNAGIGSGDEENHRQVAIYCYLSEKAFNEQRQINELWDEREESQEEGESSLDYMRRVLSTQVGD